MLRAALDAEERARLAQRVASRANMTAEQRAEERAAIEDLMAACPGLVPDEDEQEALIDLGYVPVVDPFSLHAGIDPADIVAVRGLCMSRASLLQYLDERRDEAGAAPVMSDGLRITEADMRALRIDPMQYRFFNAALLPVRERPPVEEVDLAALGLDVDEVRAIQDAMDEAVEERFYIGGTFPTRTVAEQLYLAELARDALSLPNFIVLLNRSYTIDSHGRTQDERFAADNNSLISNLAQSHVNRYDNEVVEPTERRTVSYHRMMAKIEYLLATWRNEQRSRYNIYLRNNAELRAIINMHLWLLVAALEAHAVDTLMVPFIDSTGGLFLPLTRALALAFPSESRQEIADHVNILSLVRPDSAALLNALTTRAMMRGLEISQQLAVYAPFALRNVLSNYNARGVSIFNQFHFDIVAPEHVSEQLGIRPFAYDPMKHDLLRYLARDAKRVETFVACYRRAVGGADSQPIDISENNWRALTLVLCYPDSLFALLRVNYANERTPANRMMPLAQRMTQQTKEFFLEAVNDAQSIARMRFYFGLAGGDALESAPPPHVIDISMDDVDDDDDDDDEQAEAAS